MRSEQKKPIYFSIYSIKNLNVVSKMEPEEVIKRVCEEYKISKESLLTYNKSRNLSEARHIAMYLCTQFQSKTQDEKKTLDRIAKLFNRKEHSTIIHAKKTVSNLIQTNREFKKRFFNIIEKSFSMKQELVQ